MIPQLINTNNKILGSLNDCTRLYVTEERNGIYEAEFDIPVNSAMHNKIKIGHFIYAKPDDLSENQKFRIYKRIYNPIDKTTVFYCEHIRYKLAGIPVAPKTYSGTPSSILSEMLTSVKSSTEFTVWSDISTVKDVKMDIPSTAGAMLAGQEGSILDTFGGEYKFDKYTVKLYQNRGQEKKTEIRYRKNITGFTCTEDTTSTYTHVYPYYRNEDGVYVELDGKVITLGNAWKLPFENCYMLDLSAEFDTLPTKAQLLSKANAFIRSNDLDTVSRHYKVSFVPLWQTAEYKNLAVLERCGLCDTVSIVHDNETVKAKIIKTVYDALNERYVSMELGNAVSSFAQTVQQSVKQVTQTINNTKSFLQQSIERQTKRITGNQGGYIVLRDSDEDGLPDEQLIMDNLNIGAARKMWRWNLGGLGYSRNGYAGPFEIALTDLGEINASMITTGSLDASIIRTGVLNADLIKAGKIQDVAGKNYWNMTTGEFHLSGDTINSNLSQQNIFNILTNNGQTQGIYLQNGKLYLNATYMNTGTLDAGLITTGILNADRIRTGTIQDTAGNTSINLTNGIIKTNLENGMKMKLSTTGLLISDTNDNVLAQVYADENAHSSIRAYGIVADNFLRIGAAFLEANGTALKTNTLQCNVLAEINKLKFSYVYDAQNNNYKELEFKRISVVNADTGNTELMRILVQKE